MSRWISLIILLAVIAVTSVVLYRVMSSFLLPLFIAAVLTVIFRPLHAQIQKRLPNRPSVAAMLTTAVILLTVLLPFVGIITLAVHEAIGAVGGDVLDRAEVRIAKLRRSLELELPFGVLMDEQGSDPIFLSDLDNLVEQLPVSLPESESIDRSFIQNLKGVSQGLHRLNRRLDDMRYLAQKDKDNADDSSDMKRVKRMLANEGPDAFQSMTEIQQTVDMTLLYAEKGPSVFPIAEPEPSDSSSSSDMQPGTDDAAKTTDQEDSSHGISFDELRRRYRRISAIYTTFRVDLQGGPFWAWLTDFVNPSDSKLDSLRASVQRSLRGLIPSVAGQATAIAGSLVLGTGIMALAVFYFLKDGPAMIESLMKLSPLDDRYERELVTEFESVSRAVVLATLLSALGQGVLAGVAYVLIGFHSVFLLTTLTIVFALIPFIGAAAIWFPACLWLAIVEERVTAAVILFIYGATIVSMADNVIKPYILHGQSKLHPLLALLSVLGGVQALGPIGILVGPMVVSFLQALLNILQKELQVLDRPAAVARSTG